MSAADRKALRMMFGGRCAYCGCELGAKWHKDHVLPVRRTSVDVRDEHGRLVWNRGRPVTKYVGMRAPENDVLGNFYPACVKCNILKSDADVEGFRRMLAYFAKSVPEIRTYSHVRHLMRFGKLTIDASPVVFWFEQYDKQRRRK